jgi:hypothetical protein
MAAIVAAPVASAVDWVAVSAVCGTAAPTGGGVTAPGVVISRPFLTISMNVGRDE